MADAPDPRIGTTLEGRYRLEERLAAGGMGVVYKGELTAIGKPVAVKFLHDALTLIPDIVKRFAREATAMSKLAHPQPRQRARLGDGRRHAVPGDGLRVGQVAGRGARRRAAAGGARGCDSRDRSSPASKRRTRTNVVHRDLKPDNIVLLDGVEGDFVKILDFGLAKVLRGEDSAASQLTNTGFALGTPGYMSPEQARGTEADERSDVYAVGVILYHMVTGRKPFVADSPIAVLRMHMDDAPTPPNALAARLLLDGAGAVILRAHGEGAGARAGRTRARWRRRWPGRRRGARRAARIARRRCGGRRRAWPGRVAAAVCAGSWGRWRGWWSRRWWWRAWSWCGPGCRIARSRR